MRRTVCFLFLLALIARPHALAQRTDPQREVDERLASTSFQSQDYEQAKEVYKKLYDKYGQSNHFFQLVECQLRLRDYDDAEKELKRFIRKNPNHWKPRVDLVYVYSVSGEKGKADDLFEQILKGLPDSKNGILNIVSLFRSRALNDYALAVLEKGAQINVEGDPLYLEIANLYHTMNNYQMAFEYYFRELEARPQQYGIIKNRFQTLLLYDVNKSIADEMRIALLKKNQEHPDNTEFSKLLVWFALQEEDYDIALAQCISLDQKNNDQDQQIASIAEICTANGQYELAIEAYDYILKKGKINPYYGAALIGSVEAERLRCQANHISDRQTYERLNEKIQQAYDDIGSKEYPNLAIVQAEIMAYHLDDPQGAISLLQQTIGQTNTKLQQNKLKLALADLFLYTDEVWEATLLYSQVDKSMKEEPLGHEARFKNAQLRYFIGEFAWAETQLNVLKAATSKLIANDAMTLSLIISDNLEVDTTGIELARLARADFKIYQHKEDQALLILDSINANGNEISKPHALYRTAQISEKNEAYAEADSLFLRIVNEFPDSYMADDALMKAALIEDQHLKAKETAKQHYEALIDHYPTSLYTAQAKKNYRKL